MRNRKPIQSLNQIKTDPDIRMIFPAAFYKGYFGINQIAKKYHLNIAVMARHVALIFEKQFREGDEKQKDAMITRVLQSIHGVEQLSILGGGITPAATRSAAKGKGVKTNGKKRKLESKPAR